MIIRILVVILFTIPSFIGLILSFAMLGKLSSCLSGGPCELDYLGFLFSTAWYFYFIICYRWIKDCAVAKKTRMLGAFFGGISILVSAGFGLLFTLPSVVLMLYIHFNVPYKKQIQQVT